MRHPLKFFAVGLPKAQPRARARACGRFAQVYNPKTADDWKTIVRNECQNAWDGVQWQGPLKVNILFVLKRPKSHFRAGGQLKPTAPLWHTAKPDRDNLDKSVLDALTNLGVWGDDKQVCDGRIQKRYGPVPGCLIEIAEAVE